MRKKRTLSIDIGGSGLKAAVLDERGRMLGEKVRVATPSPASPRRLLEALDGLVARLPAFDRVSVGFPGVIRNGRVLTAHNLGDHQWQGYRLAEVVARRWSRPVRTCNDADMQGLAVVRGKGLEVVVTLGTGFGSAMFEDGRLLPHLEFAHHRLTSKHTYEQFVGQAALERVGRKRWNRRVEKVIESLRALTHFDRLYVGGGNARLIRVKFARDVRVVSNKAGILGGIALWKGRGR
ncbi:MAG: ROK family protein [Acidobacteriota bacterium]